MATDEHKTTRQLWGNVNTGDTVVLEIEGNPTGIADRLPLAEHIEPDPIRPDPWGHYNTTHNLTYRRIDRNEIASMQIKCAQAVKRESSVAAHYAVMVFYAFRDALVAFEQSENNSQNHS